MNESHYLLKPIGVVRSHLKKISDCPKQGSENAPEAWLEIDRVYADALDGIRAGQEILVLTWLDRGQRDVLKVHPRGVTSKPLRGVFATRSPDRPNPIGLHKVEVLEIRNPVRLRVRPLEVLDMTPILDIKPVMHVSEEG